MQRTSGQVIQGWAAVLLAPIALPIALIAGRLPGRRTVDRTPADVAGFLRDFADGTGGDWDWDEFECVPITDPRLDAIRRRAVRAGPPNADLSALRRLAAEADDLLKEPRVYRHKTIDQFP
jgi:hypothetical protein